MFNKFATIYLSSIFLLSSCLIKNTISDKKNLLDNNPLVEFHSDIGNQAEFRKFIKTIQNSDCLNFKNFLGDNFYFSMDEATIGFYFERKNGFIETTSNTDICEFFFDQKKFNTLLQTDFNIENEVKGGSALIANSKKIYIYPESDQKTSTFRIIMIISKYSNGPAGLHSYTPNFFFLCASEKHTNCYFEGVSAWTVN